MPEHAPDNEGDAKSLYIQNAWLGEMKAMVDAKENLVVFEVHLYVVVYRALKEKLKPWLMEKEKERSARNSAVRYKAYKCRSTAIKWQGCPGGSTSPTPDKVFLEACDVYFRHCHNKPYGFFNSALFQQKVAHNQVPLHLRLALIATAARYSSRSQWRDRKQSTIDEYARCSWELIVTSQNGLDDNDEVTVVQALALLAVIDATAGRRRGAWVKIGMAVRISQDLQMMLESSTTISELRRDERRNLFWSLYLLDRFVCCSFQRPHAIRDSDCLLNLPTHHYSGKRVPPITLGKLLAVDSRDSSIRPGMFGISIALSAVLGRTIQYMMNDESTNEAPWDPNSSYHRILTDLEFLKELAVDNSPILAAPGQPRSQSEIQDQDRERIAHMVLSHTLYHLAYCILGHPLLLGMKIQSRPIPEMPTKWLEDTRTTSLVHAGSLITVLVEAKAAGYMPVPSVYSYCILVASTIHALHLYSEELVVSQASAEYLRTSLDYLSEVSELWCNAQVMADALKSFALQCARSSDLLLRDNPLVDELSNTESAVLKSLVDYWAMMDPLNPVFEQTSSKGSNFSDLSDLSAGCLTPPIPEIIDSLTLEGSLPGPNSEKTTSVDPDIVFQWPVAAMSPIGSDDENSPRWDWDNEFNIIRN
ncbi:hypothetical protein N7462_009282 [Penicillium macrosclerotiorum]|uniref:uncharacterized protein n=1 Tax=Penicillium macrosclerotiorum TaxID=303699 RepID=UPI00254936C2|nr:uncharacterized protein N7462_009282 [Penicillium macrosclerotiorum]KAJ5673843.1 hypothetical protein N7462_009282 [Penicillium macrosclerotiorum]